MFILYDLAFLIIILVYLPVYALRRKFHKGFFSRFGMLPFKKLTRRPLWIHAVSVGEVMSLKNFLDKLRQAFPGVDLVISTVTPTGNKVAMSLARGNDRVIYLPFDISFIVNKAVKMINPLAFIIVETEIWPNLISAFSRRNIPVILLNSRISDRSYTGYRRVRFFIRPVLSRISLFCCQGQTDAQRLKSLGAPAERINVTGNIKFDNISVHKDSEKKGSQTRKMLSLSPDKKLLIAASTHPGEEEIILEAFKSISAKRNDVVLLIAPRHPERARDLSGLIRCSGYNAVLLSTLKQGAVTQGIFVLDSIGKLMDFYAAADIVFVGGSLVKKGGHNILEPAAFSKPVLHGSFMFNFRDIAGTFVSGQASIIVNDAVEFSRAVDELLNDREKAAKMGEAGLKILESGQGAADKDIQLISKIVHIDK